MVRRDTLSYRNVHLDEGGETILYLCGVAKQPKTATSKNGNNFHLAMRVKPGASITLQHGGVDIEVANAERLRIDPVPNPPSDRGPEFTTCRNWQFANAFAATGGQPPAWG